MKPLQLYTVFHANLDFSALPDRDLPLVIARCYWPLLTLAQEARMPLGIEFPARTLQRIEAEDPHWLKAFRELAERGLVEAIGSGWAQVVGPLAPADVNWENLTLGRDAYASLLGRVPETWFVPEQTYSAGFGDLYAELGARSLVMEWNNPASRRPELRPLRFRAARLANGLRLLWNDCIFFQKLQRTAHGDAPARDYLDAVVQVSQRSDAERLCVYGGDLEIFDYRPGRHRPRGAADGVEMKRLGACLRALAAQERCAFALPRDVAAQGPLGPQVELTASEEPIPCKKQPRYNPTRWAVSGRDGFGMNTRCYALRRELQASESFGSDTAAGRRALVELWGSDYRTRATEERVDDFHTRMGSAQADARRGFEGVVPSLGEGETLALFNPGGEPWEGDPIQVELALPPGRLRSARCIADEPASLPDGYAQLEVSSRHGDGSVRRAVLVVEPRLAPGQRLGLRLVHADEAPVRSADASPEHVRTNAVEASFLLHRGGALAWLRFPDVAPEPLVGTIPHGSFDDIAYTPDFYTGHAVAVNESAEKVADLSPVTEARVLESGPVRCVVEFENRTPLGEWTKRYALYHHRPRMDLIHRLRFNEARLASLRLGTITALPDAFERDELSYTTVNGGLEPEHFVLERGFRVSQHQPISVGISASSCLGATEGWVSVSAGQRGFAVVTDRSLAASAPLLEFADVDERFFLRIHHSVAENDETRATFFRGERRFGFAVLGHHGDWAEPRRVAKGIQRGLVYRTENGVGIARGL